jgi:hypothetical protein
VSAGDVTPGRRVPLTKTGKLRAEARGWRLKPGEYSGPVVGYTGDLPALFFCKPNGALGHITSPPHAFVEEDDGTLTVQPSISNLKRGDQTGETDDGWHGFLEHGAWRQV